MGMCIRCGIRKGIIKGHITELRLNGNKRINGKLCKSCYELSRGFKF